MRALRAVRRGLQDLVHRAVGAHHQVLGLTCDGVEQELSQFFHLRRVEVFLEISTACPGTGRNRLLVDPGGQMPILLSQKLEQRWKTLLERRRLARGKPEKMADAK